MDVRGVISWGIGVIAAVLATAAFVAPGIPAAGQVLGEGYPGSTSTSAPQSTEETQNGGAVARGETAVVESCGYRPRTGVTVTFAGQAAGSALADAAGCVTVSVTVTEQCPEVIANGTRIMAKRGRNDLVVSGTGANGAGRIVTTRISVTCSGPSGTNDGGSVRAASAGTGAGERARSSNVSILGEGATVARAGVADDGVVAVRKVEERGGPLLPATGAGSIRLAAVAAVLLVAGAAAVTLDRGRHSATGRRRAPGRRR